MPIGGACFWVVFIFFFDEVDLCFATIVGCPAFIVVEASERWMSSLSTFGTRFDGEAIFGCMIGLLAVDATPFLWCGYSIDSIWCWGFISFVDLFIFFLQRIDNTFKRRDWILLFENSYNLIIILCGRAFKSTTIWSSSSLNVYELGAYTFKSIDDARKILILTHN